MTNFQMDVDETAMVRFIDPNEEPYILRSHWVGGSQTCTCELPGFDGKCVYCYYQKRATRGSDESKNLWPSVRIVSQMIDFRYFHVVEETSKGRTKKVLKRCASDDAIAKFGRGRGCKYCNHRDPSVSERHFGGLKKWELSEKAFDQLVSVNEKLSLECVHMDDEGNLCGKTVYIIGFACAKCGELLLEEDDLRNMDDDEISDFALSEQECECGHTDWPAEVAICETEEHDPIRGNIFLKPIEITCSGKKAERGDRVYKNYNYDKGAAYSDVLDHLVSHGIDPEAASKMLEGMDLPWAYRPEFVDPKKYDSNEEYVQAVLNKQSERLSKGGKDRPNPYSAPASSGGGGRRSRVFGRR